MNVSADVFHPLVKHLSMNKVSGQTKRFGQIFWRPSGGGSRSKLRLTRSDRFSQLAYYFAPISRGRLRRQSRTASIEGRSRPFAY
jgi:hypothetical protein